MNAMLKPAQITSGTLYSAYPPYAEAIDGYCELLRQGKCDEAEAAFTQASALAKAFWAGAEYAKGGGQ